MAWAAAETVPKPQVLEPAVTLVAYAAHVPVVVEAGSLTSHAHVLGLESTHADEAAGTRVSVTGNHGEHHHEDHARMLGPVSTHVEVVAGFHDESTHVDVSAGCHQRSTHVEVAAGRGIDDVGSPLVGDAPPA